MLENIFESFLFKARLVTLFAVLGSLFSSVVMFIKGSLKIASNAVIFWGQITGVPDAAQGPDTLVALFVSSVDTYLFATVLLIFSIGLYELFISQIDSAGQRRESCPHWLKVNSLDDLKSSLGKVIQMILIVWFFEKALIIEYHTALDLLYLGIGILLISGALYLTHAVHKNQAPPTASEENAG